MSYDAQDYRSDHPKYETVSEQKYKTIQFNGELQDDREDWWDYIFYGNYYEFGGEIRFVEAQVTAGYKEPLIISQEDLINILRFDIREELNTDYSIIFETTIELK